MSWGALGKYDKNTYRRSEIVVGSSPKALGKKPLVE